MTSAIGHLATLAALVIALAGSVAAFYGGWNQRSDLITLAKAAAFMVFGLLTLACGIMIYALVTHDFSVQYVADVGSRETPLYYTIISLWAALEGSILFWGLILTGYTVAVILIHRNAYQEIMPYIVGVMLVISAFFLYVMSGPGNPFVYVANPAKDGPGPNPLLQNHPMMGLHPPLLYLGYVGLSVPFAIAMAGLISGDVKQSWLALARKWSLVAWCFLTLGIIAGMWWSYAVLGWGGYWSWDPVENAVLMPWLVTTAFLHSIQVQERRKMLKTWTISLIVSAFLLSIMGTFLTRSGVLASVHSFTQSSIGPVFLAFLGFTMLVSIGLILARSKSLSAPGSLDSLASRESAFLLNNLLLVALTFTILLGTLFPLIAEAATGQKLSVGAPYFDRLAVPIVAGLLFLMGVGPILPWGASNWQDTANMLVAPAAAAVAMIVILIVSGVRGSGPLAVFALVTFVATSTAATFARDVRTRRSNTREHILEAAALLIRANPRRYGGYLAHFGLLFIVLGVTASQAYSSGAIETLSPGQSMHIGNYGLTLAAVQNDPQPNRTVLKAIINVSQSGTSVGSMAPSVNTYPTSQDPVITPDIHMATTKDLYLVIRAVGKNAKSVTLQAYLKPLVSWIWFGGILIGLAAVMALMPARRRKQAIEVPQAVPEARELAEVAT